MANFDPHTGAPLHPVKQSSGCLKPALIGCGIFLVVAVVLWAAGTPSTPPAAPAAGSPAAAANQQAAAPSYPIVSRNGLDIGLSSVEVTDKVGLEYMQESAADGGVLVVLHYRLRNGSERPIESGYLPKMHLVDGKGTVFNEDLGKTGAAQLAEKDDVKLLSDLNPGITLSGVAVFEVSKSAFDAGTWSIRVGNEGPLIPVSQVPS